MQNRITKGQVSMAIVIYIYTNIQNRDYRNVFETVNTKPEISKTVGLRKHA